VHIHQSKLFRLFVLAFLLLSCSSTPSAPPAPAWISQPARTVDGGYIVYVASSEDRSADQARFKAESQAYEDLANECSFPPKGARMEDNYLKPIGTQSEVFVKVAVDFQTCEEAKQAIQPEDIRKLANVAMTDEIKKYQNEYEKEPQDEDEEEQEQGNQPSNETQAVLYAQSAPPPVYVSSPTQFYIVRQQVWYAKQDVILSPPTAYQPGTPQSTNFVNQVQAPVQKVQQYEAANPTVRSSPQTWSTTHQQAVRSYQQTHPASANRMRTGGAANQYRQGQGANGRPTGQGKGRKRRRRWN
jgi:hypothetical protein